MPVDHLLYTLIMEPSFFRRYILFANWSTNSTDQTQTNSYLRAHTGPLPLIQSSFAIHLHHRQSSPNSEFGHMNIMGRRVLGATPTGLRMQIVFRGKVTLCLISLTA